jgi:FkbM family methyltransferase
MRNAIRRGAEWLRQRPRLGRLALRLIPDLPVTVELPHLGRFRIRLRRNRSFWLRDPEAFERVPFGLLASLVRVGDTVADLGANVGLYARFLVQRAGAARVVAFEPWPENLPLLQENLGLGGIADSVSVHALAIGDVDGEQLFQVDDVQSTSGSLDSVRAGAAAEGRENLGMPALSIPVACRSIDSLLENREIPEPAVLKIDVEGAEGRVLTGAMRFLERRRPRLLVEIHGAQEAREVSSLLCALGYEGIAQVEPSLDASGYLRLSQLSRGRIVGRYDVHFIAASCDGGLPSAEMLASGPFEPMG